MGTLKRKRPRGTPQRNPFRWSTQETAALLAWADRCLELELNFKNTVAQQLKQKWPQRDYKYDVIENKVKRLWARMGNHGTDKLDIISEGTRCLDLDCFDDDERKALHEAKSEFPSRERRLRSRARSKVNSTGAEPFHASARSRSITVSPLLERGGSRVHPKIENEGAYRRSPRIAKRVGSSVRVSLPFPFILFSAPNSRGSDRPGHHRPRNPGRPRGAQYGFRQRFLTVTMLMHKRMVRSPSTCY
ncbi:uncharacterized protein K441DRAFT_138105 [Cenococcum geophilum 1.58]|uniref:uncharacterized protein n=1 Tax=Cenococcum geophilum 1.58 TaxID=794803 RepID=UPI00358F78AC|nr:hypothetical protein K441DRAFT_138105 [Cenococcum geophilum 1.58]